MSCGYRRGAWRNRHHTYDVIDPTIARTAIAGRGAIFGRISIMRCKALCLGAALAASCFALLPQPAPAGGNLVAVKGSYAPGTIVIRTNQRRLYLMLGGGEAMRYPVGVGRRGMQWSGKVQVDGKYVEPAWAPPASIKRANPRLPNMIPGGSPHNPMGVAALTLSGGGQYAIHGTNQPNLIGGFVSHGCIRMYNADITDLYNRIGVGTPVVVTR
jgi:lipoprotein-anchoring transpeptidase ErfK/SrfK